MLEEGKEGGEAFVHVWGWGGRHKNGAILPATRPTLTPSPGSSFTHSGLLTCNTRSHPNPQIIEFWDFSVSDSPQRCVVSILIWNLPLFPPSTSLTWRGVPSKSKHEYIICIKKLPLFKLILATELQSMFLVNIFNCTQTSSLNAV